MHSPNTTSKAHRYRWFAALKATKTPTSRHARISQGQHADERQRQNHQNHNHAQETETEGGRQKDNWSEDIPDRIGRIIVSAAPNRDDLHKSDVNGRVSTVGGAQPRQ